MKPTKSKNFKLATEFYDYCCAHPELRFWQALLAWSKLPYIFTGSVGAKIQHPELKDTFYWIGKNK